MYDWGSAILCSHCVGQSGGKFEHGVRQAPLIISSLHYSVGNNDAMPKRLELPLERRIKRVDNNAVD
jgi:hypothetical protein